MEGVVVSKSCDNSAAVYLTAALLGVFVGMIIAFIFIAWKDTALTPSSVVCNANNLLYTEVQKIPDSTVAGCVSTFLGVTPQVCTSL